MSIGSGPNNFLQRQATLDNRPPQQGARLNTAEQAKLFGATLDERPGLQGLGRSVEHEPDSGIARTQQAPTQLEQTSRNKVGEFFKKLGQGIANLFKREDPAVKAQAKAQQVKQAKLDALFEGVSGTDKATILRMAQSPEMAEVMKAIDTNDPSSILSALDVTDNLKTLELWFTANEGTSGKTFAEVLPKAVQAYCRENGLSEKSTLEPMNRNLLNCCDSVRTKFGGGEKHGELQTENPNLRLLQRAVRDELLRTEVKYPESKRKGPWEALGSGAAHTVEKAKYKDGTTKVFKHDDEELRHKSGNRFAAPARLGIDQSNPQLLERAVISSRVAEKLGLKICVKTDFAERDGEVGIVMDLAKGTDPHKMAETGLGKVTHGKDALLRDLAQLQLFDALMSQGDRHGGNYMIMVDKTGRYQGLKAIDNDFCLGTHPNDMLSVKGERGIHWPGYPPAIDQKTAKAFLKMTDADLQKLCGSMVSDGALDAMKGRLQAIKDAINGDRIQVIKNNDWGKPTTQGLFGHKNSYYGRDQHEFEGDSSVGILGF